MGGLLDSRGGAGGIRGSYGGVIADGCNGGGAGGKGFLYLMDIDGSIFGLPPGTSTAGETLSSSAC